MKERISNIKQPLGIYDVFGYILPGFFFFALFIIDFDGSKILRNFIKNGTTNNMLEVESEFKLNYFLDFIYYDSEKGFGIIPFIIFLIFCYLVGHIMASFSSFLSKQIVRRFLKFPSDNLFPEYENPQERGAVYKVLQFVYTKLKLFTRGISALNYKRPFDKNFRKKYKETIDEVLGYEVDRSDYYWLTYSNLCVVRPDLTKRIQHFVNLAGFARNVTGTFLFYLIIRFTLFSWLLDCLLDKAVWIILAGYILTMFVLFWTFLRLYKRQAVDMFYIFYSVHRKSS